jgi:KaiC/GvpD/RAD55 family RecA-like ATPase
VEPYDVEKLMENISMGSGGIGDVKRVVIDSISMFELYMQDPYKIRKNLFSLLQKFKDLGKTVLVVAEVQEDSKNLSRFGVIEFMVDGVILLQYLGIAKCKRSLSIRKMRMTNHSSDIHPFDIGPKGITIHKI